MTIDLKHEDTTAPIDRGSDTRLLAARAIAGDFFMSRTALALGIGWLGLFFGMLIGRW